MSSLFLLRQLSDFLPNRTAFSCDSNDSWSTVKFCNLLRDLLIGRTLKLFVAAMDVISPSSINSATSMDRPKRAEKRYSSRRRRSSLYPTAKEASTCSETLSRPEEIRCTRTESWNANFDNLLHDCTGLATFSVSKWLRKFSCISIRSRVHRRRDFLL